MIKVRHNFITKIAKYRLRYRRTKYGNREGVKLWLGFLILTDVYLKET